MPGGKITIKSDIPDLESFLARKRYPLDKWLLANNITSPQALKGLTSSGNWVVSSELEQSILKLLQPVSVAAKPVVVELVKVPVVATPKEPLVVLEQSQVEEKVEAATTDEVVPHTVEDTLISSQSYKERKKSR